MSSTLPTGIDHLNMILKRFKESEKTIDIFLKNRASDLIILRSISPAPELAPLYDKVLAETAEEIRQPRIGVLRTFCFCLERHIEALLSRSALPPQSGSLEEMHTASIEIVGYYVNLAKNTRQVLSADPSHFRMLSMQKPLSRPPQDQAESLRRFQKPRRVHGSKLVSEQDYVSEMRQSIPGLLYTSETQYPSGQDYIPETQQDIPGVPYRPETQYPSEQDYESEMHQSIPGLPHMYETQYPSEQDYAPEMDQSISGLSYMPETQQYLSEQDYMSEMHQSIPGLPYIPETHYQPEQDYESEMHQSVPGLPYIPETHYQPEQDYESEMHQSIPGLPYIPEAHYQPEQDDVPEMHQSIPGLPYMPETHYQPEQDDVPEMYQRIPGLPYMPEMQDQPRPPRVHRLNRLFGTQQHMLEQETMPEPERMPSMAPGKYRQGMSRSARDLAPVMGDDRGRVILTTERLCKSFQAGSREQHILKDLDIDIYEGDFTIIMGPSGAGKSTLLYAMSGMDRPSSGLIRFFDEDITEFSNDKLAVFRRKNCGFIFQQMFLLENMSILENILVTGLLVSHRRKPILEYARRLLSKVELSEEIWTKFPAQLSGGENQRAAVVRALINKPKVIFADEPTGSLNSASGEAVLDVLTDVNGDGQSIIMVTHDLKSAWRGNRILYIRDGVLWGECQLGRYAGMDQARYDRLQAFLSEMGW